MESYEPKIVAMYRIKNEERWIKKSLESISDICSSIVILDDGSQDNTVEICKKFDKVVDIHHQENLPFDVVRDGNKLLEMALEQKPDFILRLDGDEIIQPNARKLLFEELTILYPNTSIYEFQSITIWDKPSQYRYDGVYSNIWAPKLLRLKNQPMNLAYSTYPDSKLHTTLLPTNSTGWQESVRSRIKIFHYGNYDEGLRQKKYKFYTAQDPNNETFDGYIHIISGKGKFSGPDGIQLRTLPNGMFIELE